MAAGIVSNPAVQWLLQVWANEFMRDNLHYPEIFYLSVLNIESVLFKQAEMKKIIVGISAMLFLASAAVFAGNRSEKKADCCAPGKACCYAGSPCCSK